MMATTTESELQVPVLAVTAAVGAVVLLFVLLCGIAKKQRSQEETQEETEDKNLSNGKLEKKPSKKKQTIRKETKPTFSHAWLLTTLKCHSSPVLDLSFSPNGKYLATCAADRTVLLWSVKEFSKKDRKPVRANVELDHATNVTFSPDNKSFITSLAYDGSVRVYKIGKKSDGTLGNIQAALDFPTEHETDIVNIGIASSGRFMMTSSKDTQIKVWDLKGDILSTISTLQVHTSYGAVSPCGRFIGSSGFTPDVKVWEVCFDKGGNFQEVVRAFDLKGHLAAVSCFDFSDNSHRMVTVSKDGTWKLWDTNVEYKKSQDAYLIQTGTYKSTGDTLVALSPDGRAVAVSTGTTIHMFDADTAKCEQSFDDVHTCPISCLAFDPSGRYLVSAGDKHIHVIHNVIGHQATIRDLTKKMKTANTLALRERISQQVQQARLSLNAVKGQKRS